MMKRELFLCLGLLLTFVRCCAAQQPRLAVGIGHVGAIYDLTFHPRQPVMATASMDETIKLWNTRTGRLLRTTNAHSGMVSGVAFNPDGDLLASCGGAPNDIRHSDDFSVKLWNVATGQQIHAFPDATKDVHNIAFSPDGRLLAGGCDDGVIKLWEVTTGKPIQLPKRHGPLKHITWSESYGNVSTIAFTPDSRYLVSSDNTSVEVWELISDRKVGEFEASGKIKFVGDDLIVLADSSQSVVQIWNWRGNTLIRKLKFPSATFPSVTCTSDGTMAITMKHSIEFRNIQSNELHRTLKFRNACDYVISLSPDGKLLVTESQINQSMFVWNARTGERGAALQQLAAATCSMALSPSHKWLISGHGDGSVRLWNLTGDQRPLAFRGHHGAVRTVIFSPSDSLFASSGERDDDIRLWSTDPTQRMRVLRGRGIPILAIAFSPNGTLLISLDGDTSNEFSRIAVWDIRSGRLLRSQLWKINLCNLLLTSSSSEGFAISPNGQYLAHCGNSSVATNLWQLSPLTLKTTWTDPALDSIQSMAFSPDGEYLAEGGYSRVIRLRNAKTGKTVHELKGHTGNITSLVFSGDAKSIASGSDDKTVRIWDVSGKSPTVILQGHNTNINSVAFQSGRDLLASSSQDGTIKLWDLKNRTELANLVALSDGGWVVARPSGLFDTNDLDRIRGANWVMPDSPYTALPPEMFMRHFYEPQLLPRIINHDPTVFNKKISIANLNRVQPLVKFPVDKFGKILAVTRQTDMPDRITVTIQVGRNSGSYGLGQNKTTRQTDVYGVRLYRDGQLVGQYPELTAKTLQATPLNPVTAKELANWRELNHISLRADGSQIIRFRNIRLPHHKGKTRVEFSAYAFNEDRVKSETQRVIYHLPPRWPSRKGRAYIITVGVNAYKVPGHDLRYAVNDVRVLERELVGRLARTKQYESIIPVQLRAEYKKQPGKQRILVPPTATKANFQEILSRLAGRLNPRLLRNVPNAGQLRAATPEDLIIVAFSGHGDTDKRSLLHLYPYDIVAGHATNATLFKNTISTDDLTLWLQHVDAGRLVMIFDACRSGSVQPSVLKPGPMGDRGLSQLAYDKGMSILAATQARDDAVESGVLRHGVLTYALCNSGFSLTTHVNSPGKRFLRCDTNRDGKVLVSEWLTYGTTQVPQLYADTGAKTPRVKRRHIKGERRRNFVSAKDHPRVLRHFQQPVLFDFHKRQQGDLLLSRNE